MRNLLLTLTLLLAIANARANPFLREFPAGGKLEITLEDKLKLAAYSWPRTLLAYNVDFRAAKVPAGELQLRDEISKHDIPFQLSVVRTNADGTLRFAVVNFLADLPSGGERRFALSHGRPMDFPAGVKGIAAGNSFVLDAGKLQVRVPASRQFVTGEKIPGPILALNRGNGWIGDSQMVSSNRTVKSVTTERIEAGPLFIIARVTYQFSGGGVYA
ncbi:MAG: hypothetical protein WCS94_17975, partial [Verrucomicrobiota bacterium]